MSERTALYRLFDSEGSLLYVGITKSVGQRWEQHAATQPWYPEVQRQTVDWFPNRAAAEDAERATIQSESPRYNIAHTDRPRRGPADRVAALMASPARGNEALANLSAIALNEARAAERRDQSHSRLVRAVWEAADQGMPQVEIVRVTGRTRERIRQLCDPAYRERAVTRWAKD